MKTVDDVIRWLRAVEWTDEASRDGMLAAVKVLGAVDMQRWGVPQVPGSLEKCASAILADVVAAIEPRPTGEVQLSVLDAIMWRIRGRELAAVEKYRSAGGGSKT